MPTIPALYNLAKRSTQNLRFTTGPYTIPCPQTSHTGFPLRACDDAVLIADLIYAFAPTSGPAGKILGSTRPVSALLYHLTPTAAVLESLTFTTGQSGGSSPNHAIQAQNFGRWNGVSYYWTGGMLSSPCTSGLPAGSSTSIYTLGLQSGNTINMGYDNYVYTGTPIGPQNYVAFTPIYIGGAFSVISVSAMDTLNDLPGKFTVNVNGSGFVMPLNVAPSLNAEFVAQGQPFGFAIGLSYPKPNNDIFIFADYVVTSNPNFVTPLIEIANSGATITPLSIFHFDDPSVQAAWEGTYSLTLSGGTYSLSNIGFSTAMTNRGLLWCDGTHFYVIDLFNKFYDVYVPIAGDSVAATILGNLLNPGNNFAFANSMTIGQDGNFYAVDPANSAAVAPFIIATPAPAVTSIQTVLQVPTPTFLPAVPCCALFPANNHGLDH